MYDINWHSWLNLIDPYVQSAIENLPLQDTIFYSLKKKVPTIDHDLHNFIQIQYSSTVPIATGLTFVIVNMTWLVVVLRTYHAYLLFVYISIQWSQKRVILVKLDIIRVVSVVVVTALRRSNLNWIVSFVCMEVCKICVCTVIRAVLLYHLQYLSFALRCIVLTIM